MFLLFATLCLVTVSTEAYTTCGRDWLWPKLEQKNCFKPDDGELTILLSDGKHTGSFYSGIVVEEYNDAAYVKGLACRCANAARKQNYQWFALGNNKVCYTSCKTFNQIKQKLEPKDNCYNYNSHGFGDRDPVTYPQKYGPDDIVLGGVKAMSVYELEHPPPPLCGEDIEEENEMAIGSLACFVPADIVILVDQSGSVGTPNFHKLVEWLKDFIKLSYDEQNRFGLFGFDDKFYSYLMLEDSKGMTLHDILSTVSKMRYTRGSTLTQYALWKLNRISFGTNHVRKNAKPILVVITDGQTWGGVKALRQFTPETRALGVTVIAIGIGEADRRELEELTGLHKERVFKFDSFKVFLNKYKEELTRLAYVICDVVDGSEFPDY